MPSIPDDSSGSIASDPQYQHIVSNFRGDLADRLDVQQMFILIDGVLPFEACLYHQVLPLYLEGTRLILGMVSLEDAIAADYVRRIIAYHNYRLVPRAISSEALQASLSAYLNYSRQQPAALSRRPRHSARARSEQSSSPDIRPTLVVDSPEALEDLITEAAEPLPHPQVQAALESSLYASPPVHPPASAAAEIGYSTLQEIPEKRAAAAASAPNPLLLLKVQTQHLHRPAAALADLPPDELLQELLGRVLAGGIGRLYFERQKNYGRVLWSQDGVLKSVLDQLNLNTFRGVIHELKVLAQMPLLPIEQPKQVEVEKLHEGNRVLLRFRFMPGTHGEEATIQVLRGAALKFYQQQQVANLEREALRIARQLQSKLREISERTYPEAGLPSPKLETLPALQQLIKSIEGQLNHLAPGDMAEADHSPN